MQLLQSFRKWKWETKLFLAGWYFTLVQKTYKVDGLDLIIPFEMTDIRFRGFFPINFYEKEERRYLKQYLPEEASVLELGACLGVVSCLTNRLLKYPERHVVVEANPALIEVIRNNKKRNSCGFSVENCMISSVVTNEFYVGDSILMSSNVREAAKKVQVEGRTIKDLELKYDLHFDVLVMDIEGGEFSFLKENADSIRQFKVIFMETHPHPEILSKEQVDECWKILKNAGFDRVVNDQNFWVLTRL
jgi:FkbM family methyltransferase